jgi:hypothetical protein
VTSVKKNDFAASRTLVAAPDRYLAAFQSDNEFKITPGVGHRLHGLVAGAEPLIVGR